MDTQIIGLLAETFIHPGIGRTEGVIDLPVAREAATDYPYIPGSSVKGALRDYARENWPDKTYDGKEEKTPHANILCCFGEHTHAGGILISDARLVLLPVRSLSGSYRWVTSFHLLERLQRDLLRSKKNTLSLDAKQLTSGEALTYDKDLFFLEERSFNAVGALPEGLVDFLAPLIKHKTTSQRLEKQLVILSDDDFTWFARYALSVRARNVLDEDTKASKNLWYEETLPPDSLFYTQLTPRVKESGLDKLEALIKEEAWFQIGGNETIGQGLMAMQIYHAKLTETSGAS